MKRNNFKMQSGRSMVEMLGVLAIIGVLSVGGIAGYNMAIEKHRLNEAIEAVNLIATEIRALYASQGNYNDLGRAFSKNFDKIGATAGGDSVAASILEKLNVNTYYPIMLNIETKFSDGINHTAFSVAVINISQSNCVKLSTMDWSKYGSDYDGVSYDGGKFNKEISISEAQDTCKSKIDSLGFAMVGVLFNSTRKNVAP